MSTPDLEFRWTLGVSALTHATLLGVIWFSAAAHAVEPVTRPPESDVWIGTTVSVVEAPREPLMSPVQPESGPSHGQAVPAAAAGRHESKTSTRTAAPETRKLRVPAIAHEKGALPPPEPAATRASMGPSRAQRPSSRDTAAGADGVDLKQAMQDSVKQPAVESGTFGAAGVDLTERRLPKAFTRALPVAIGAEPGWWRQPVGPLGSVRFTVALTDNGKLDEVTIDDESKHPFHARVVRRVARLLALGTFALPTSTTGSAEQAFELRLVMERQPPDTNSTADPGDLVEKGFEAPSATKPGLAIVRDAPGHTLHAILKLLPARRDAPRTDHSSAE